MRTKGLYFLILVVFCGLFAVSCEEDLLNFDFRDELEGKWNVAEDNNLKSTDYYTVTISKSSADTSRIRISNFYAVNGTIEAVINGYNLSIPQQTVNGFIFSGYGTVKSSMNEIGWSYTVNHNNGFIDQVTATYTKTK